MYAVMWSEHCSYKSSKRYLGRLPHRGAVGPRRSGRGRGRDRRRRRPRGRHPHREPQPPVGGRALPGRGHRRRRDHPRRLLHGCAPDRADGPAALRAARRPPHPLPPRGRRRRHQRLRQRGRGPDGRRRGGVRRVLPRQPARQRAVPRRAARRPAGAGARPRVSATSPCCSARPPGATASAGRACSPRPASPRATRPSGRRSRWAIPTRRSGSSRPASSCSTPASPSACRTSAPPASRARRRRRRRRPARAWTSTSPRMPKREPGMNGVEVMTSESQERMLAIVTPANLDAVLDLCRRWEIRASVIGRVTDTARFRVYDGLFDAVGVPGENPPPPRGDAPPARVVRRAAGRRRPGRAASATVPCTTGPRPRRPQRAALHADDPASVLAPRFPSGTDLSAELLAAAGVTEHRRQVVGVPAVRPPAVPQHRGRARRRRVGAPVEGHVDARSRSPPTARRGSAALDPVHRRAASP